MFGILAFLVMVRYQGCGIRIKILGRDGPALD